MTSPLPPSEVDLLVLGSGAAGMTAALAGSIMGLSVLLVEKTDKLGGTTSRSAGSIWLPNTCHAPIDSDSYENVLTYMREAVGNPLDKDKASAFLKAASEVVELLETNSEVKLRSYPYHPDYLSTLNGATLSGRVLEPLPFDASVLGKAFKNIRAPLPEFTLLGGMMVDRTDIGNLTQAFRKPASFWHTLRLLFRYGYDRLRYDRGTRLVMGNALVARLYASLIARQVPILLSAQVISLGHSGGRVDRALIEYADQKSEILLKAGVVLATGGISHHPELRESLMPANLGRESAVVDSATGDGLKLAQDVGGHLGASYNSNSFWAPVSKRQRADGSIAVFPHFVLDRGKPGAIAISPTGNRFVNEATTYHLFGEALFDTLKDFPNRGCYLICDTPFIQKYGLGMVRPKGLGLRAALSDGYIVSAVTLHELAQKIGVPNSALAKSVARHNAFAEAGKDEDFAKGEDAYQQNLGDTSHLPNPCLGPTQQPPFYAVEIFPGDIGASAGLATNAYAQILDGQGDPIHGLYACGNDMESLMAGSYPGPGITLGPAMAFAFIAARHALNTLYKESDQGETP